MIPISIFGASSSTSSPFFTLSFSIILSSLYLSLFLHLRSYPLYEKNLLSESSHFFFFQTIRIEIILPIESWSFRWDLCQERNSIYIDIYKYVHPTEWNNSESDSAPSSDIIERSIIVPILMSWFHRRDRECLKYFWETRLKRIDILIVFRSLTVLNFS